VIRPASVGPDHRCRAESRVAPRPVLRKFGCFAQQPHQMKQFFQSEGGNWTITGPGGTLTDTWSANTAGTPAVGTYVTWSPILATTISPNGSTPVNGVASFYYGA
jgi:hypothetical protein